MSAEKVKIDTSLIPEHTRMRMLDIIYPATVEYFHQPGVEEQYQQWLNARAAKPTGKEMSM